MFILFLVLIVGPIVAGKHLNGTIGKFTGKILGGGLAQPTGLNNNDTGYYQTGTGAKKGAYASATMARFVVRDYQF